MNTKRSIKSDGSNPKRARSRRGISLIIVILLLSMTMAVSFAAIHSQGTAITSQQNSDLRARARQAALTGMAVAIREAHSPSWIGTEVSFSKDLGKNEYFNATYSTGDSTLSDGDTDYDEYPYRVTILVTGYATDPNNTDIKASHRIEAVIRLVPEAVDADPYGWYEMQQYRFCQREYDQNPVSITVPCRIEGPVRIRGRLDLCADLIKWDPNVRTKYFEDLRDMKSNGWPDYRPFSGSMYIPYGGQDAGTTYLLRDALGVHITDTTTDSLYAWSDPLLNESYQLFPGGKTYSVEIIGGDISNTELKPDPKTNPLGIFICSSKVCFLGNVSMQGTLITRDPDNIEITSGSNQFSSLTVPPYEHRGMNTDARFRLPTVIGDNDFRVSSGVMLQINGLAMLRKGVEIKKAVQYDMSVTINGNVSAKWLKVDARSEWGMSDDDWDDRLSDFDESSALFFPVWLLNSEDKLNPQPQIQIKPDSDQTRYHWYSGDNPLFKHPKDESGNDKGLAWEIMRWTDNP